MPDYPDPFRMNPGDKAIIELQYKKPLEKLDKNDHPCILYSVQVSGDGVWRTWFTSPEEDNKYAPYLAHQMIKERGYGPDVSLDIELLSEGGWRIRGETWADVMGGPAADEERAPSGDFIKRIGIAITLIHERLTDLEKPGNTPPPEDNLPF